METHKCPKCGMELPEGGLGKLCPRCVLDAVIQYGPEDEDPEIEVDVGMPATPIINGVSAEKPGDKIGHYRLLQHLGEGGMGIVWMAEQMEPVRRIVALKVIKPGMDSKEVLARFESERQALALMDHPNIAKVLDAGATPNGRPYFVMDLIKGIPLIQFCDEQKLPVQERLKLFIQVCQAIQHAHQKGIIHRDIKPSNVMVALYDGKPVPKVIDFGIAKAMGQQLTERTLHTRFGALLGTLEYMSPEQAEWNQLDIDTRSDIYSLGVLLYEILTGTRPLSLQEVAFEQALKRIKEEEPPTPSQRLTSRRDKLPVISAQRKLEPEKLTKLIRGELDWIVMKALDKDRNRRYETATMFAQDLQRYLNDEAVMAGPPTATYRMKKFVRKHKPQVAVAVGFVLLLSVATVVSTIFGLREQKARREAEINEKIAEQKTQEAERALYIARNNETRALTAAHPQGWTTNVVNNLRLNTQSKISDKDIVELRILDIYASP